MRRRIHRFTITILLPVAFGFMEPSEAAAQRANTALAAGTIVPELALAGPPADAIPGPRATGFRYSADSAVQATDSTRVYRRSYWLEGGVVGAALMGLVGAQIAHSIAEPRKSRDYVGGFVGGALIGLPVGALIGGLLPKGGP